MNILLFYFLQTIILSSCFIPTYLNGKKILLNGPSLSENKKQTRFDGNGCITSIVFNNNRAIVSEAMIPYDNDMRFPLSDYMERDYFKILSKLPYIFFGNHDIQSGTRNTAVQKLNDKFYAVEESCRPYELYYENDIIKVGVPSKTIDRMAAHLLDDNTFFSYTLFDKYPLKINNTISIPWSPFKQPAVVHDGVNTYDKRYFIFPLTSTGMGRMHDYFCGDLNVPFDDKLNKGGWLIYDRENHKCKEILMDEYVDLFHISHIEHITDNIHKLYVPFIYNFTKWVSNDTVPLNIFLKTVTLDLTKYEIVSCDETNLRMDFINKEDDVLIGCSLCKKNQVVFYNIKSKSSKKMKIPGENIREIVPYRDILMYFSHENKNSRTYFYIVSKKNADVISKIPVPNRPPGFHTTFF